MKFFCFKAVQKTLKGRKGEREKREKGKFSACYIKKKESPRFTSETFPQKIQTNKKKRYLFYKEHQRFQISSNARCQP